MKKAVLCLQFILQVVVGLTPAGAAATCILGVSPEGYRQYTAPPSGCAILRKEIGLKLDIGAKVSKISDLRFRLEKGRLFVFPVVAVEIEMGTSDLALRAFSKGKVELLTTVDGSSVVDYVGGVEIHATDFAPRRVLRKDEHAGYTPDGHLFFIQQSFPTGKLVWQLEEEEVEPEPPRGLGCSILIQGGGAPIPSRKGLVLLLALACIIVSRRLWRMRVRLRPLP